jgi:hypothetical protein
MNGAVIYHGPSMLDGMPIVAIATGLAGKSANAKTGAMVQVWILRADIAPQAAAHSGADASICGNCPHRGDVVDGRNVGRTCYVTLFQAPRSVFASWQRGIYPAADDLAQLGAGRMIRLGAYGDPAAVPLHIWEALTQRCAGFTGYTHQWARFPELAPYCMASCDSNDDRAAAKLLGFRTFRVRAAADPLQPREVICPASAEAGKRTSCAECKACGGTSAKAKADIAIVAHGVGAKQFERRNAA